MKYLRLTFKASLIALLATFGLLSSCVEEGTTPTPKQENKDVVFAIRVPASNTNATNATRAITEGSLADNNIDEIDILLFDASQTYVRSVYCQNIDDTSDPQVKIAKTRLPEGTYHMVMIANAHRHLPSNLIAEGTSKDVALKLITTSLASFGDKWNSDTQSSTYKSFPMWGEVSGAKTIPGDTNISATLYRALSKINLTLDYEEDEHGEKNFQLTSISIYNYNKDGQIVPNATNWGSTPKKATELKSRETGSSPSPLSYDATLIKDNTSTKQFSCIDEIFIFESSADNSTPWSWEKNTCVIIGGLYEGIQSYYRIDFIRDDNYIDIVRNHSYLFAVEAIKTQGYTSELEALKNQPENLTYTVHTWNNERIGDLIVQGPIQMSVYPSSRLEYTKAGSQDEVHIYTNYKDGWQTIKKDYGLGEVYRVEDASGNYADWATVMTEKGDSEVETPLVISVQPNDTDEVRTAYVYIKAGRIEHKITVFQSDIIPFHLDIEPNVSTIEFYSGLLAAVAINPFKLLVEWAPTEIDASWDIIGYGAYGIEFEPGFSTSGTFSGGSDMLTMKPVPFDPVEVDPSSGGNPFLEKTSRLTITAEDGAGGVKMRSVLLKQINFGVQPIIKDIYQMNGTESSIIVKANAPWRAELIDGGKAITELTVFQGKGDLTNGEELKFNLAVGDENNYHSISQIRIFSPTGLFEDVIADINGYLLIWYGNDGYLPAPNSSAEVLFSQAASTCPEGYIFPNRALYDTWINSNVALPSGGHWVNESGVRNFTKQTYYPSSTKTVTTNTYATRASGATYSYSQIGYTSQTMRPSTSFWTANLHWGTPTKVDVIINTYYPLPNGYQSISQQVYRDGEMSSGTNVWPMSPTNWGTEVTTGNTSNKAMVRCVKKVAQK